MTQNLERGQWERAPSENNRCWKKRVAVFTSAGKEDVDIRIYEWPDGRPCEVYLSSSRSGTLVDNFLREIGKNYSRLLQLGAPPQSLSDKLRGEVGPLAGEVASIGHISGIQDLVSKVLGSRYG